jgi:murein DD-endopeptidase MepM/ murein hydrolase activator NlpD
LSAGYEPFSDVPQVSSIEEMLNIAEKQLKKPYQSGKEGPYAFDCSGFTRFCYKHLGITLNRSSKEQADNGERVRRRNLRPGDLVFFKGSKGRKIGHVGIVVEKSSGKSFKFIHASTSSGIIVENGDVEYFKKRYKTARRITTDRKIRKELKRIAKARKKELKEAEKRAKEQKEELEDLKKEETEDNDRDDAPATQNRSFSEHIVQKGDTLYNISKRYGCTVEELQRWNSLAGNNISLGQTLKIMK